MSTPSQPNVAEFYERQVLPALMARLDDAFPEFGWRRDPRGWRATNDEFTHSRLGARAERVVCHGEAPRGLLVHGDGPLLWTTYVNDGAPARGRDFVRSVRLLADRAGVDASTLDRAPTARERRAALLEEIYRIARDELMSPRGGTARAYLANQRGMPVEAANDLGLMPTGDRVRASLAARGYSATDVVASGITTDQRWAGRLVGAGRDHDRTIGTMWARTIGEESDEGAKYLYLAGHPRGHLPPYGLAEATEARSGRLHLVEGLLDVHHLRAIGPGSTAALGGTSVTPDLFTALDAHGVQEVVFCFDNDPAGLLATERAIDAVTRAARAPDALVVDPRHYGTAKDADELVRTGGAAAWNEYARHATCAVAWRAMGLHTDEAQHRGERAALRAVGAWLGGLPERLAVEQDQVIDSLGQITRQDATVLRRAFRARYWTSPRRTIAAGPARAR